MRHGVLHRGGSDRGPSSGEIPPATAPVSNPDPPQRWAGLGDHWRGFYRSHCRSTHQSDTPRQTALGFAKLQTMLCEPLRSHQMFQVVDRKDHISRKAGMFHRNTPTAFACDTPKPQPIPTVRSIAHGLHRDVHVGPNFHQFDRALTGYPRGHKGSWFPQVHRHAPRDRFPDNKPQSIWANPHAPPSEYRVYPPPSQRQRLLQRSTHPLWRTVLRQWRDRGDPYHRGKNRRCAPPRAGRRPDVPFCFGWHNIRCPTAPDVRLQNPKSGGVVYPWPRTPGGYWADQTHAKM